MSRSLVFPFTFWGLFVLLAGCKADQPAQSEEEVIYMADYEAPHDHWGFVDTTGNLVIDAEYDDAGPFSEGLAAVSKNGKWGYIDKAGKMVIPAIYRSAWAFHEGFARVLPFDGPDAFIDKEGTVLPADNWAAADDFSDGRARVKVGNAFGYIDPSGNLVVQPLFTRGWNYHQGLCVVEYNEKIGVINPQGDYIVPAAHDQIRITGEGSLILVRSGDDAIAFDASGKKLLSIPDARIVESNGEYMAVREGSSMYITSVNEPANKSSLYSNIIYLEEDRWAGKRDSGYVMLTADGREISEQFYHQINKFSDGYAAYNRDDYWGYLDTAGIEMTGEVFGLAWDYREGFARAAFREGIAFINTQQKLAFYPPPGTIDMRDFTEGLAAVQID